MHKMTVMEFALACGEFTIKSFEAFKAQGREVEYKEVAKKIHNLVLRADTLTLDSGSGQEIMDDSFVEEFLNIQEETKTNILAHIKS